VTIVNRGTVFAGRRDTDYSSACFPGVCVLPGGRWLVTFRAAPTKACVRPQRTLLACSDDQGAAWAEPFEPWAPPLIEGKPGAFRAGHITSLGGNELLAILYWVDVSDPSLPFFNEQTEGLLDSRLFMSLSEDAGASWSEPELIDTSPYTCPTPITGPAMVLDSGEWALQFETNKSYYDTSVWRHESVVMFSADGGRSWPRYTCAATDPSARVFYWDQRPTVLPDGRIMDVFWTFDRETAQYLNIHARMSADGGRTWGAIWDTGVPGQPAAPIGLSDGRLLLVYVDRTAAPVIKARISADDGRTWPDESESVIHGSDAAENLDRESMQDAWAEMSEFSIGLPATALLPNDEVLVVYYAGPMTDLTDIQWARLRVG